jgi:hypothetical protein
MNLVTRLKSALGALILAAGLCAQTCIYSWSTNPSEPGQNPLRLLSGQADQRFSRIQMLLPATLFGNVPVRITEVSLPVRTGWRRSHWRHFAVRMRQTSIGQLSSFFAANVTGPFQDVMILDDHVGLLGVGPAWVPLGLQQPFLFIPGRGDLLIELEVTGGRVLEEASFNNLTPGYVGSMLSAEDEASPPTSGVFAQPPSLRFCVDRAEISEPGQACGGASNQPPVLGLQGTPSIGGQTSFWLSNAPPNALAFLALGFDNRPPFPLDLTAMGAPGCKQYFPVSVVHALVADGLGIAEHVEQIPNNQSLIGSVVFGQHLVLSAGSNALGGLTSNYGRLLIGR